jgi:hypothetical protein
MGVTSSFDFCNTTRNADSPRDSFVPRACAGRGQTRSPRLLSHRFTGKSANIEAASGAHLLRASTGRGHRARGLRLVPSSEEEKHRSRAPTRHVPSTPWSPMRAREHWGARRFRIRRRPISRACPAKGRRAAMNRSAFHRQDRLHAWRSLSESATTGLPWWRLARRALGGPTPLLPFADCRP